MATTWVEPMDVVRQDTEVLLGVELWSASDKARTTQGYSVRFGISQEGRTDWIGDTWDQGARRLDAGVPIPLYSGSSNPRPLRKGQQLVFEVTKKSTTDAIRGLAGRAVIGLSGARANYKPAFSAGSAAGSEPISALAEQLNKSGVSHRVVNVHFTEDRTIPTDPFSESYGLWQHQESAGTDGGTATAGGGRETRTLNTEVVNLISGASLASNNVTLPAGTYYVRARTPFHAVRSCQSWLYDTTNSADLLVGEVGRSAAPADPQSVIYTEIVGKITLGNITDVEIQSEVELTNTGDGYGHGHNFGSVNVYTSLEVWKL